MRIQCLAQEHYCWARNQTGYVLCGSLWSFPHGHDLVHQLMQTLICDRNDGMQFDTNDLSWHPRKPTYVSPD